MKNHSFSRDLIHEASPEVVCQHCGYPCDVRMDASDIAFICQNDGCKRKQTVFWVYGPPENGS